MSAQEPSTIVIGGSISVEFNHALLQGGDGRFAIQDKKFGIIVVGCLSQCSPQK